MILYLLLLTRSCSALTNLPIKVPNFDLTLLYCMSWWVSRQWYAQTLRHHAHISSVHYRFYQLITGPVITK